MSTWAEAEEVARRVYAEDAEWCEESYLWLFAKSALLTGAAHGVVRFVAERRGWRSRSIAVDWDSRVVSTVNAVLALRAYALLDDPLRWSSTSYDAVLTARCDRDRAMLSLAGYLSFDLVVCVAMNFMATASSPGGYGDPLLLAHHAVVVVAFLVGVRARLATAYMAALLVNEASTPFVNLRSVINSQWPPPRPRTSPAQLSYVLNGLCLVSTYFLCRVAWTFGVVVHAARAWVHLWRVGLLVGGYRLVVVVALSLLLLGHLLINCLWFKHVINHLLRQLREPQTTSRQLARDKKHDDDDGVIGGSTTTNSNGHPPPAARSLASSSVGRRRRGPSPSTSPRRPLSSR
mmetsp:Transcript_29664/g.95647  ORF Transcript_29664/g.95647 Transcript_29664/m.95647 type:complete len:347 (+) Transcript_29664:53-1093(+)